MFEITWRDYRMELGKKTHIMGILNVTPDSFSDGGIFFDAEKAVRHAMEMEEDGADIIDIGGESTRPFSEKVGVEEEIRRVVPIIEKLAGNISIPMSIDTTKAEVALRALEAGASIINDISALRFDPGLADVAAKHQVPVILMHMKGNPKTMQIAPEYSEVVSEVSSFLNEAMETAVNAGISKSRIIIDPGIGFGKTFQHNLILLNRLNELKTLDLPILVGPSRKAFLRNLLKNENEKDIDPLSPIVETGTQAAVAVAAMNGAHILRVHDVKNTRNTLKIIDAVKNS